MFFEERLVRFGTAGTLIAVYTVVDRLARRIRPSGRVPEPAPAARVPSPRWLAPFVFASVLAFYLTIDPYGRAIAGGAGNAAGVLAALAAAALRWRVRRGAPVRHPTVATRMLFYTALPLAVGSPPGWLALTAPAALASAYACVRQDRRSGVEASRAGEPAWRWVPGVW